MKVSLYVVANLTSVEAHVHTKYKSDNKKWALLCPVMQIKALRVLMTHTVDLATCIIDEEASRIQLVA
jgi:hypothetical protein